jgi:transcription termination/antitermination protein NusA
MINIKQIQNLIDQIVEEKDLNEEEVQEAVLYALAAAYKKDYRHKDERVEGKIDPVTKKIEFFLVKTVIDDKDVEEQNIKFNPYRHILLSEALKINPNVKPGDEIRIPLEYKDTFSRIAAQTAKQVITQRLKEITKNSVYQELKAKENKVISGIIQKVNHKAVYVDLGKAMGIMFRSEAIPGEFYKIGNRMRFYVYGVEKTSSGVEVYLSRANPLFVPALFTFEIPEISEGIIEIKGIARIPGVRSKMAVKSNIEGIDAVGTCIGPKGARVLSISNELNGEKIDIIQYSDDPVQYVLNALSPAKAVSAEVLPKRTIKVYVTEDQIPVALGKNGQNIKLAAKLTGWRIDVRLIEEPEKEIEGGIAEADSLGQSDDSSQSESSES